MGWGMGESGEMASDPGRRCRVARGSRQRLWRGPPQSSDPRGVIAQALMSGCDAPRAASTFLIASLCAVELRGKNKCRIRVRPGSTQQEEEKGHGGRGGGEAFGTRVERCRRVEGAAATQRHAGRSCETCKETFAVSLPREFSFEALERDSTLFYGHVGLETEPSRGLPTDGFARGLPNVHGSARLGSGLYLRFWIFRRFPRASLVVCAFFSPQVQTSTKPVIDDFVSWEEQLVLCVGRGGRGGGGKKVAGRFFLFLELRRTGNKSGEPSALRAPCEATATACSLKWPRLSLEVAQAGREVAMEMKSRTEAGVEVNARCLVISVVALSSAREKERTSPSAREKERALSLSPTEPTGEEEEESFFLVLFFSSRRRLAPTPARLSSRLSFTHSSHAPPLSLSLSFILSLACPVRFLRMRTSFASCCVTVLFPRSLRR